MPPKSVSKPPPSKSTSKAKPVDTRFHHPFDDDDDEDDVFDDEDDEDEDDKVRKPGLKTTGQQKKAVQPPTKTLDPRFAAANNSKWALKFGAVEDEDDDDDVEEDVEDDGDTDQDNDDEEKLEENDDAEDDNDDDDDLPEELNLPPDQQPDILNNPNVDKSNTTNKKPLSLESLKNYSETVNKTGLVYISRLPPFMTPEKLRSLLAPHGKLGRLYAAPEDAKTAYRRKKYRGNKRVNYTEAWVEFEDKAVARRTAEFLNLRPMGTRKRDRFYDDLWTIKYLPRFKWNHLTDQISYERAVRDQKLKAEMEQVKRETKAYLQNVERGKMIEAMEAKKKRKREEEGIIDEPAPAASGATATQAAAGRKFRQREVKQNDTIKGSQAPKSATKAKVLSKIFG